MASVVFPEPASPYATYFDIDWEAAEEAHRGRVLLPILGAQYGIVLERGELRLAHETDAGFVLLYYEHRLPIDPATYPRILSRVAEDPALAAPLCAALRRVQEDNGEGNGEREPTDIVAEPL